MSDFAGKFENAALAKDFILAGKARVTFKSLATEQHYTYRIKKAQDADRWFVSYLAGADNENDYVYMGVLEANGDLRLTAKSHVKPESTVWRAFRYGWGFIVDRNVIAPNLEIWHEGRCGRCARVLTVPESVERGFGPECAGRVMRCDEVGGNVVSMRKGIVK